jgi:hypothetical protein
MKRRGPVVLVLGEPEPEAIMNSYFFYIHDRRYSVPQFVVVDAKSDADAVETARKYLTESAHYLSIDILDGDREVAGVKR